MKFSWPTDDQLHSVLRHIYTMVATAVSVMTLIGLSQSNADVIVAAVHKIGEGASSMIAGVTMLIPVASAVFAAISAGLHPRLMSLNQDPEVLKIEVKSPAVADAIPGNKVVARGQRL